MATQDWEIKAPPHYVYTPEELAQIGRAVQAFQAALPHADSPRVLHLVTLHGVGILHDPVPASLLRHPKAADDEQ